MARYGFVAGNESPCTIEKQWRDQPSGRIVMRTRFYDRDGPYMLAVDRFAEDVREVGYRPHPLS